MLPRLIAIAELTRQGYRGHLSREVPKSLKTFQVWRQSPTFKKESDRGGQGERRKGNGVGGKREKERII